MMEYLILLLIGFLVTVVLMVLPFAADAVAGYYWKLKDVRRMVETDEYLKGLVKRADEDIFPIPRFNRFEDFQKWLHSEYRRDV